MTSNIGAKKVSEFGGGIGFSDDSNNEKIKDSIIRKSLKNQFSPEFLNRIDDVIVFDKLDNKSLKKIVQIELDHLGKRLLESNYEITFHKSVVDEIINRNSEEDYGARPIKRIIQNLCEDFISDNILKGDITKEMGIILKIKEGNLEILKNTPLI
jgi:ATP-dependent Clp protease ATP-binding subunit ClpC